MNAIFSPTTGILVSAAPPSATPDVQFLAGQEQWSELESLYALSSIHDWQVLNSNDNDLIERCTLDYWVSRSQSLIVCLIDGVSTSLATEALEHIEQIIQSRCSANDVLNRLLIAPLNDPARAGALARLALSHGFAAVATLLDRLVDLQLLLRRLTATWLALPPVAFTDLPVSREVFWYRLAATGSLLARLLEAADNAAFKNLWVKLAINESTVAGRQAIIHIGNVLADTLYPARIRRTSNIGETLYTEHRPDDLAETSHGDAFPSFAAYSAALKQVDAIAEAVAQGKDAKATRFLRDLIQNQSRLSSREQLAKSLCNIAQKCACMFRPDFERECLNRALSVAPDDSWTIVQMGNYLKRIGQFHEAIDTLRKAANSADAVIATSSIADVWCEAGDYSRAEEVYHAIPGWQDILEVRTGLADIRRHKGEYSEAISEYDRILADHPYSSADRAAAGKAEIFKYLGRFDDAVAIYDVLIYDPAIDNFAKLIYRLAKCAVLKRANKLDDAFRLADDVVRMAPFHMLARVHRASILALLGHKAKRLLASLPRTEVPQVFGAWVTQYCRGLLLLKLDRYKEARRLLLNRFSSAIRDPDSQAVLRLGAAFAFLYGDDLHSAARVLAEIRGVRDYYTQYVYQVLQYHLSVATRNSDRIAEIAVQLENVQLRDSVVVQVIAALEQDDFSTAKRYELELLLRLAA